jgi:predicted GIY-YIG superfamily endonuclease
VRKHNLTIPTNPQDKINYVYLIQSLENGYYKVGVSKHPQRRIEQLQTGNSSKLKLVEIYQSEVANKIEKIYKTGYYRFVK